MFDFIVQSSQKRILQRAKRALEEQSSKVEICGQDNGDFTLLVDGHLDVWIAEDDWDCSCTSKVSPCQHVLVSVLAIQQGVAKPKMKTIFQKILFTIQVC